MITLLKSIRNALKHWYISLIIGLLFIALGIYIFFVPLETYLTLSLVFCLSFVASGILDIYFSIENRKILSNWGWYFVGGLLSLAIGIYLFIYPNISINILPYIVGFTLLFRSFQLLGFSFELKELKLLNWGNLALTSVLGIIFSILLLASPSFTAISLVILTALAFIFVGISSITLSFNLKKIKDYPYKKNNELKTKLESLLYELNNQK